MSHSKYASKEMAELFEPFEDLKLETKKGKNIRKPKPKNSKPQICGRCIPCVRTKDCLTCDVCTKKNRRKRELCEKRICVNFLPDPKSDSEDSEEHLKTNYSRQCYGLQCVKSARYGSKYCSDKCGMVLAKARILQILPQRLYEHWLNPSGTEVKNRLDLVQIRQQQREAKDKLEELNKQHKELDELIRKAKALPLDTTVEDDDDDSDASVHCVTCGQKILIKSAMRHMEKCFIKFEAQTSFTSFVKTKIEEADMFCDFYNAQNKTYCKRLRVMCPEHCRDPKVSDDEICGFPFVKDVFTLSGEFCRASKNSCDKHYAWEKIRRADIDQERVRQWLKIDELVEKERYIKSMIANRAGVLPLILHNTYNHEVMERVAADQLTSI